jgi:hypothetical protein
MVSVLGLFSRGGSGGEGFGPVKGCHHLEAAGGGRRWQGTTSEERGPGKFQDKSETHVFFHSETKIALWQVLIVLIANKYGVEPPRTKISRQRSFQNSEHQIISRRVPVFWSMPTGVDRPCQAMPWTFKVRHVHCQSLKSQFVRNWNCPLVALLQAMHGMRFSRVEPKSQRLSKTLFLGVYLQYPRHFHSYSVGELNPRATFNSCAAAPQMAWPRQMSLAFGMPRATGYLDDGFGKSWC